MTYTLTITDASKVHLLPKSNFLEENDQNLLLMVRDWLREGPFIAGDMAERYVQESARNKLPYTAQQIYTEIGRWIGKRPRTIRYYHETARFFPLEARDKYPFLPFGFFVFARSMDAEWEEVLETAVLEPYMTLDQLIGRFRPSLLDVFTGGEQKNENPVATISGFPDDKNGNRGEIIQVPPAISRRTNRFGTSGLVVKLSDLIGVCQRLMEADDVDPAIQLRIAIALEDLLECLPALARPVVE